MVIKFPGGESNEKPGCFSWQGLKNIFSLENLKKLQAPPSTEKQDLLKEFREEDVDVGGLFEQDEVPEKLTTAVDKLTQLLKKGLPKPNRKDVLGTLPLSEHIRLWAMYDAAMEVAEAVREYQPSHEEEVGKAKFYHPCTSVFPEEGQTDITSSPGNTLKVREYKKNYEKHYEIRRDGVYEKKGDAFEKIENNSEVARIAKLVKQHRKRLVETERSETLVTFTVGDIRVDARHDFRFDTVYLESLTGGLLYSFEKAGIRVSEKAREELGSRVLVYGDSESPTIKPGEKEFEWGHWHEESEFLERKVGYGDWNFGLTNQTLSQKAARGVLTKIFTDYSGNQAKLTLNRKKGLVTLEHKKRGEEEYTFAGEYLLKAENDKVIVCKPLEKEKL